MASRICSAGPRARESRSQFGRSQAGEHAWRCGSSCLGPEPVVVPQPHESGFKVAKGANLSQTINAMSIRVAIVEDDAGMRETLKKIVQKASMLSFDGAYRSAEEAFEPITSNRPDVALVDINLPGKSGITLVAELKARLPKLQVMMITVYEDGDQIFDSLQAGASGYLLKRSQPQEIVQAIVQLHAGGAPMSAEVARKVVDFFQRRPKVQSELKQLSAREMEILRELSKGYRYKEIADRLDISVETVRSHVHHIYDKLHVESRVEAVMKFVQDQSPGNNAPR
jgi:DNA-binding NarL/FixJ family response regulator